ncbi:MAG TPA: hypothetical protein VGI81_07045 [Tepidisphaeraceae bacterium]|jgi:hypothetical protein
MNSNRRKPFTCASGRHTASVSELARREAGRALAMLWFGRELDRVGLFPSSRIPRRDAEPDARFAGVILAPAEQDAVLHLAAFAAALRGRRVSRTAASRDPDLRRARAIRLPPGRTLAELDQLTRRHLAAHADLLNALAAALQARGTIDGTEVRRMVLRAQLRRPPGR